MLCNAFIFITYNISLFKQLPAVYHEGLTIVFTPILALIQDQIAGMRSRNISCATLNSTLEPEEKRKIKEVN